MTVKRLGKKILKITGILLGVIAVLLIAFHFWFINHAKGMLEDTVSEKTNGKIKLTIEKLRYNYFTQKMELDNAVFFTTDTLTAPSAYRFKVTQLRLQLRALLPLILKKKLMIDSLFLQSPDIEVTILRHTKDTLIKKKEDISIPYEMGKVYKSIQDGLKVLKVNRFQIQNGTFTLINRADPDQLPLTISQFNFHIDNLQVGTAQLSGKEKLLFSDNVVLTSRNQNIIFPDGRHRLSFSRFRINLKQQLVEFDSCTIEATKKDSTGSSFKVFFNALLLTNIDFDTLYRSEVIKADSVYCINPKFTLDVGPGKSKGARSQTPTLEKIIEQLTGDLQLGYVGVENADFNIKTIRDGKPSSFTFSRNNFEMEGLSIDQEAAKPILVKNFAMAIRNYENFIKDSSYTIKFDSIIFKNNRLTLSNFLFNKVDNGKIINTFSVPQFSLEGLSWDYLVFEKKLKAKLATMYQPHISYTAIQKQKQKKGQQNIFHSLGAVNEYMDLEQLDITNGDIDLTLKKNLRVQLTNATLSVQSHSLLSSTKMSGIKNSLSNLQFDRGRIHAGNLLLELKDIRYAGNNGQFAASLVTVTDKEKNLAASLHGVAVNKLIVDEVKGNIDAEGINWQQGTITMNIAGGKNTNANGPNIAIKGIQGFNTSISSQAGNTIFSTDLSRISLHELKITPGAKPVITGLTAEGKDMKAADKQMTLSVHAYEIADNKNSLLQQVSFKSSNTTMNTDISISSMSMVPHIQSIVNGDISLDAVQMNQPVIELHLIAKNGVAKEKKPVSALLNIGEMLLIQPAIHFTRQTDSGTLSLHWKGDTNNFLQVSGLKTSFEEGTDIRLDSLQFQVSGFHITMPKGKSFNTGAGKIVAALNNISYLQKEGDSPEWNASVGNFDARNFHLDSVGKSGGRFVLNSASLKDFHISSSSILNMQQLAAGNPAFQLTNFTGHYFTANTRLQWYNAGFSRSTNMFTLDSFLFTPAMGIDSFLAVRKFQTDYLKTSTGSVQIGPVDIDAYLKDTVLKVRKALINNAFLFDHKDKSLPFNVGLIKPLPVDLLKKIPFHLSIDTVMLTKAAVEYTEVNEKTKIAGTIPVNRMAVTLLNVKNYRPADTDTLRIRATGYLLDTAWIRLQVNQSYTDSLGGFVMTLRLKPGDLKLLNKILVPMASVKLLSGELDTLNMRAIGREYLSIGEMNMFYRNLKIQLLKNGKDMKPPFFTRLASFAANTFLIKRNNSSRTGSVFFIRQRDKSAINYLIKTAISGIISSVGIKKNKKMMRRYHHELEKRKLPPVEFD